MVHIIFESHATTTDNEAHLASGHNDVALSAEGEKQAQALGTRYAANEIDAIFCSDLQRSYKTAAIAFDNKIKVIQDSRLRECDYGDLTQEDKRLVDAEKPARITTPFPHGESYEQTAARMKDFLSDLLRDYDGKTVMIIGHRATQYGLEHWINELPLAEAVTAQWAWQPGWQYTLHSLA